MVGDEALRVTAATQQTQLAHHAELIAYRDGFATFDARRPPCHSLIQRRRAFAILITDEAHKAVEHELGPAIAHAHGPLERQELHCISGQSIGCDLRAHHGPRGTGNETSRSDCVAMRT